MIVDVYNQENKKVGTTELPDALFQVPWNPSVVHQVVVGYAANKRRPVAHTKNRGEVRGGGKKPWRQKGTGRARHGSSRSPLWAGGGVTFGPRNEKEYGQKINKKMKTRALATLLSQKLRQGEIRVIDRFAMPERKTKHVSRFLEAFFGKAGKSALLVEKKETGMRLAARNIPFVRVATSAGLNAYLCAQSAHIFFETQALPELTARFKK
jgi:large subunit ribosomal protein L4